jgi:hypothetical protein
MKAGGGKAAFRQPTLFTYTASEREKYDTIALNKFPFIDKWLIYSKSPIPNLPSFQTIFLKGSILDILSNESIRGHLQNGTAVLYNSCGNGDSIRGDRVSIDNGILRIDIFKHRFFQLPICKTNWQKLIKYQPHKKSGEYPRVYLEIPLSSPTSTASDKSLGDKEQIKIVQDNELNYIFRQVLQFESNEWILKLRCELGALDSFGDSIATKIHQKTVKFPSFQLTLEEDNDIYDFINFPFLASDLNNSEEAYLYEVEGNLNVGSLLSDVNILLVIGQSNDKGVVSFTDEQHPLNPILHEPASLFMIRPPCISSPEPLCYTLCYA